jgi:hypothetical protein
MSNDDEYARRFSKGNEVLDEDDPEKHRTGSFANEGTRASHCRRLGRQRRPTGRPARYRTQSPGEGRRPTLAWVDDPWPWGTPGPVSTTGAIAAGP